ncbi:MAG: HAD family hydrolase [Thermoplasmatales archaeon]|nr:HAD family hydrolase [Thermoplasmatales archaeon]
MITNQDFQIDSLQAILFDFDGVLCECMNVKTEAFAELFKPFGEEIVNKVVEHHIENGGISRYHKIRLYYEDFLGKPITEDKVNEIANEFSKLVVEKVIASDYVKGAREFLEKYYKKTDLYVISGTPQEELDLVVDERNMRKYFKGVYGTPTVKPVHFKRIISENNYDIQKVVYIGDSLSDMKNAQEVNVPFLGRITEENEGFFPENIPTISNFNGI